MKRAALLLRKEVHYRFEAFAAGLRALGYEIFPEELISRVPVGPNSVLVIWNRKAGREHKLAEAWERSGARVIVAENGYIGKDENGLQLFAMAIGGHNGSGQWHVGTEDRWSPLGIEIKPWTEQVDGGHMLICGQRGIGSPTMASPQGWHRRVYEEMRGLGWKSEGLRMRNHPGDHPPPNAKTLAEDLEGAYGAVIWSSGAGVKALVAGIPVIYAAPHWICASAATRYKDRPLRCAHDTDRFAAFKRMAWAQWRLSEVASGEAFDNLLNKDLNS